MSALLDGLRGASRRAAVLLACVSVATLDGMEIRWSARLAVSPTTPVFSTADPLVGRYPDVGKYRPGATL
jgi:hypothetical protein